MKSKVNATMDLKSKLLDRCAKDIESILGCHDRLIITGMLVDVGHPDAMTAQLCHRNIRGFDLWASCARFTKRSAGRPSSR